MSPADAPRDLLTLAEHDYKAAMILARAAEPQMDAAGFHLQQAVEKTLKAWLTLRHIDYPKTHDLSLLLRFLEDDEEKVEAFWPLLELNSFAVQFRYELAGESFPNFEPLARLTKKLLVHVGSLLRVA